MHIKNQNVRYNRSAQAEKYLIFIVISGLVILLDQITKLLVLARMELHQSIQVISGFFSLTHVHNPGGAFGFLASNGSILRPLVFFGAETFIQSRVIDNADDRFVAINQC